ncbi:MAG: hypothetical protein JXL80_00620 [Planctomycetes bacterium]|nr:hypothetical protein [Planctomycetota bacterium]
MVSLARHLRFAVREWKQQRTDLRLFRQSLSSLPVADDMAERMSPTVRLLVLFFVKFLESDQTRVEFRHRDCGIDCSGVLPDRLPEYIVASWPGWIRSAASSVTEAGGATQFRVPVSFRGASLDLRCTMPTITRYSTPDEVRALMNEPLLTISKPAAS